MSNRAFPPPDGSSAARVLDFVPEWQAARVWETAFRREAGSDRSGKRICRGPLGRSKRFYGIEDQSIGSNRKLRAILRREVVSSKRFQAILDQRPGRFPAVGGGPGPSNRVREGKTAELEAANRRRGTRTEHWRSPRAFPPQQTADGRQTPSLPRAADRRQELPAAPDGQEGVAAGPGAGAAAEVLRGGRSPPGPLTPPQGRSLPHSAGAAAASQRTTGSRSRPCGQVRR